MFDYNPTDNLLSGRVILVSGAGDGIGRAAAMTLAEYGATVILLGRTQQKLELVYDAIEQAGFAQPAMVPLDLSTADSADFDQLADMLDQEFGQLDGLLHNASLLGQRTPIKNYDPGAWDQVMKVNVSAQFQLTQSLLPLLEKSDDASIIFTSSGVGRHGRAYWGAYAVSKFATEGLMQVLADEVDGVSNIRVNSINPGATRTQMRAQAYPAEDPKTIPTAEEIMPIYLYLLGPDSSDINGQAMDAQS